MLAVAVVLAWTTAAAAQDQVVVEGQFIAVNSPIDADVAKQVLNIVDKRRTRFREEEKKHHDDKQKPQRVLKIVFDFNPHGQPNVSTDYGACYNLAREILNLKDVTTIAFVHGEAARHTVLPVLACRERVMSSSARLGPVVRDGDPRPLPSEREAYLDMVRDRFSFPDVVLKLLNRDIELVAGKRQGLPDVFLDARNEKEIAARKIERTDPVPEAGKGVDSYSAALAEKLGLLKATAENKEQVANLYRMPASSVRDDLMGRTPSAWRVTITGAVTRASTESLIRRIRQAVGSRHHANLVILQLECNGGDWIAAVALATFLRDELRDDRGQSKVETVAYIADRAPDTAAIIAFGCSKIIMVSKPVAGQEAPHEAELGDFSLFVPSGQSPTRLQTDALEGLLESRGYNKVLARGLLERNLILHEVVRRDNGDWELLTDEEWKEDQAKPKEKQLYAWRREVKHSGDLLVLKASLAKELRVASDVVDGLPGLYALYDLKPDQVPQGGTDWLDDLAYVLRWPSVSIILVMLGITCLILEMKVPGVSLPGVVAAICFVLFFWAHSGGPITLLAILLFILGLILIGLEVFVMPGIAVVGVSGAILVILSLALVTVEKMPQTSAEWQGFGWTVTMFALSLAGAVAAALILAWYLPNIPYVNRLILKPGGEEGEPLPGEPANPSGQADYSGLLGAIGTAATPLRPAGKVQFGEQFIDVLAEGSYIETGTRVQVIEIEGNRIVVKEV